MNPPFPEDLIASTTINSSAGQDNEVLTRLFVELEVELVDPSEPVGIMIYKYIFSDMTFIRVITNGGRHRAKRTQALIQSSTKNNFFIGFMLSGEATLEQGGHKAILRAGDIALLDSTRTYSILLKERIDVLWVSVPRFLLGARLSSPGDILGQRVDGSQGLGHVAANMLYAALSEARHIDQGSANCISNHLLDIIIRSLQVEYAHASAPGQSFYQKAVLRRIQSYIERKIDDENLSPKQIASENSMSVRYLSKLFEREGTSTAKWIRLRRLERCRSDLENEASLHQSVKEIAFAHGFSNISSFNRAFKRHFGLPPRSVRPII